ncbi:hypothetical protein BH09BAC5_BH09BAC5_09120 [soil metagenome]
MGNTEVRREKVLIMGNGFDLNLGLKTSYNDFIQSRDFSELWRPNSLFSHLEGQKILNNWIDVEIELKKYSNNCGDESFEKDYHKLCEALIHYISKIDYTEINKSSSAYKLLTDLLNHDFIIFDFNYTNTVLKICNELGVDSQVLEGKIVKLHGSASEGKIIFGVEDSAAIKTQHIFLKKAFPAHYKAINLNFQLLNASDIYIFGHSLGETDHTYFKHYFETASNSQISGSGQGLHLHYYNQTAYKDLHIQLDHLSHHRLTGLKQKTVFKPIEVK